jgi:hypothetical protein
MKVSILSIALLALTTCINITASNLYISPNGNDANPGTREQPLATLTGARDAVRILRAKNLAKDSVNIIVMDGTYYMSEPLLLNDFDSADPALRITFKADQGAKPIFIGGKPITGWTKVNDNLWKTSIEEVKQYGWIFEQLYINGKRTTRAKSPNKGFYFLKNVRETVIDKGKGRVPNLAVQRMGLFPEDAKCLDNFTKADFNDAVITLYHKWDNTRKRISNYDKDSAAIFTTGGGMKPWNSLDHQTRYTIENYRAALDTAGEWFLEGNGDLYYMPLPGETPENLEAIAPTLEYFIMMEGKAEKPVENIRFENLSFRVAGYRMPLWGNEAAQAAAPIEAVVMADYARNIEFTGCEIAHTGNNAIWFRKACSNCTIKTCYFHDLGAGGIKIGDIAIPSDEKDLTKFITVDNNIIRDGGYVFPCAVGITIFQSSDNTITHNEIANFRYSGVSVGWVWGYSYSPSKRNKIEFNHIHHLGWGELCDMGGVYCLGEAQGTTVSNNVIHHVFSFDYGGWGLYTDEGSTGVVMENNLVYACKNSGFHQHYGKENMIRNNVFAANIKGQLQATRVEPHLSFTFTNNIVWFNSGDLTVNNWPKININSDKNLYWDTRSQDLKFGKITFKEWQKSGKDVHSIVADPVFINPAAFDFRMKKASTLKKIGLVPFDYSKSGVY